MSRIELIRCFIFIGAVGLVYLTAASLLVHRLARGPQKSFRAFRNSVYLAAVAGLGCMAYGYFVEPYWPDVTRVEIRSSKVTSPLRIVHLSDIHSDPKVRLEGKLPGLVAAERPDLIVYTGDSINEKAAVDVFRTCMRDLNQIAPVLAVRGNIDDWFFPDIDVFESTGARELKNESVNLEIRGNPITLIGVPLGPRTGYGGVAKAYALLETAPQDRLVVFLHHYPDLIPEVAGTGKVDLYCAGHTHGGQVALPFYGALVTYSVYDKQFESGLYDVNGTKLYVNRGIGMEGGSAPRVRFCARPEITVIDIVPERHE